MYKRGINKQDRQYESLHLQMIPWALLLSPVPSTAILKIPCIPCTHWLWILLDDCTWVGMTHCAVMDSGSSSDQFLIITRPLVMRVWILQNVCTAHPKWRQWWTKGSWLVLVKMRSSLYPLKGNTNGLFLGPNSKVFGWACFCPVTGVVGSQCCQSSADMVLEWRG